MSDRYEIQEKIGQGGIGAVYQAYDTQLRRAVAIKRMLPTDVEVNGQDSAELMLKEATTLSALQHPNIITVYDVGLDAEGPFVVMELLKGETLDQVIKRGVLTLRDFCEVVLQTMEALIAAEAAGVLHRDLKPTNVMVNWLPSKKFQVKILDFSLAKFSTKPSPQTIDQGDAIFGSIYFMAPEQFERGNLDQRTDLYSMGCLYYFCLSGQYPFQGDSAAQVMASHLQGNVVSLEKIRTDLPPVICQWVMWLINRDADNRPSNAKEAFDNYNHIAASIDIGTGPVNLTEAPLAASLSKTSRRLIVPPPKKTTAVTALPAKADPPRVTEKNRVATGAVAAGTAAVTVMPRKGGGVITYLGIALGILVLLAAAVGVRLWLQHYDGERNVQRFEELAGHNPPSGTVDDVAILVRYLDGFDQNTIAARKTLERLRDLSGGTETIDGAIVAALKATDDTRVQENLVEVIHARGIRSAEDLLLDMTSREFDPRVTRVAMEAVADFGEMQAFERLLGTIHGESQANLPPGVESALESIGRRLPDNDAAAKKIEKVLQGKVGTVRYPLIRVLGSLGGGEALRILKRFLTRPGDDEDVLNDRRAAWVALSRWPQRSPEVAALVYSLFNSSDRQRALGIYLALALRDEGAAPSQNAMIETLWTELRTERDNGDWNIVRSALVNALPRLQDRAFAREIARQMATSELLGSLIKDAARAVQRELVRGEQN